MKGVANLKRLIYFVSVVEKGSFTAAAENLGVTKAVVSQQIALLERELRASLLVRTTRKVRPTEKGHTFYLRCVTALRDIKGAFNELREESAELSGELRVTATFDYGMSVVIPTIAEFVLRHPACEVDLILSDRILDIIDKNIELAIRVGWLADCSLQAKKISTFRQLLVASPLMAKRLTGLTCPQDISSLPFVANTSLRDPLRWNFSLNKRDSQIVSMQALVSVDATLAVTEAVCQGIGLSILPEFTIKKQLDKEELIHVLPEWSLPTGGIYAVFPAAQFQPAKVRAFIDLLAGANQAR